MTLWLTILTFVIVCAGAFLYLAAMVQRIADYKQHQREINRWDNRFRNWQ